MKATRTISPFQQVISKPSEHQRRFERMTMTLPSWTRPVLRLVCLVSSRPFCCMIRNTRLWLIAGAPVLARSRFASAEMRR